MNALIIEKMINWRKIGNQQEIAEKERRFT